uniref:rRNA N-glycosylase n=1 Tax=Setaria italica TaxID=4555 RepID=K3YMZ7_SETIT
MPPVYIFLVLACCFQCFAPCYQAAPPIHHIHFDLKTETFNQLYSKLRHLLERTSTPPYVPKEVRGKVVLGQQPIDDLYLLSFRNATNYWYKFGGGFTCLPGAIVLPIRENYGEVIKGGHKNLWQVPLGNQSAVLATKQLARFKVIRDRFWGKNWEKETTISPTEAKYVVDRGSLSKLLI